MPSTSAQSKQRQQRLRAKTFALLALNLQHSDCALSVRRKTMLDSDLITESEGKILNDILTERKYQNVLKAQGRFAYTCADQQITHLECNSILGEEFGEVCHEVNETIGGHALLNRAKLRRELIQTAAVCMAWIEKIDAEMGVTEAPRHDPILNIAKDF